MNVGITVSGNFLLSGGSRQNIDGYRSTTITEAEGTWVGSWTESGFYSGGYYKRRYFDNPPLVRAANLQGALINTVAAKGANAIGDNKQLTGASKAIAHALLGCAVGTATAGSSQGCAPGAAGAAIGEIVAGLYADASGYDQLKIDANKPGASAEIEQRFAIATNTMTELAKLSGAGGALLIGGDASDMQTAMGTAANVAVNNRQLHADERAWASRRCRRCVT